MTPLILTITRTHAGPGSVVLSAGSTVLVERDYQIASYPDRLVAALRRAGATVEVEDEHDCCSRGDRCRDFARAMGRVA